MRRNQMAVSFCSVDIHYERAYRLSVCLKTMAELATDKHGVTRIHACLFVIRVSSVSICGSFCLAATERDLNLQLCRRLARQRTILKLKAKVSSTALIRLL